MSTARRSDFLKLAALALTALAGGCRDRSVTSYRVPKEADPAPLAAQMPGAAAGDMNAQAVPVAADSAGFLSWQAPADWQVQPAGPMRKGSYTVAAGVALSITAFPNDAGGALANVNRWRGQVGLPPLDQAGLSQATTTLEANGLHFLVMDAGNGSQRILAALTPWSGSTWFFKLTGPEQGATQAKPAFLAFLQTVQPHAAATPAAPAPAPMSAQAVPVQDDSAGSLHWQAPSDWRAQPPTPMRKGSYAVGADGAALSITAFPGDAGGMLANVNRWRGQVGLPPVDEAGLAAATSSFDSHGLHFVLMDAGNGSQRIVAALTPWNGGTWFFKLTGSDAAAGAAKPAFLDFLKTVQAP